VPDTEIESEVHAKGYRVKVCLPLEGFKKNHVLPGKTVNFDLGVNDSDGDTGRDSQLMWKGTDENWSDPSGFGSLNLTE
jgi:hypothetical protein